MSQAYKLDLAQASWCSGDDTISAHIDLLRMQPITLLRYTTYVEASAPVFSYNFWDTTVRTHLVGADLGEPLYHLKRMRMLVCCCMPAHRVAPVWVMQSQSLTGMNI